MTQEEKLALATKVRTKSMFEPEFSDSYLKNLEKVEIEEQNILTREGLTHIFILKAKERTENCPVYINIHGGGYVRGHEHRETIFSSRIVSDIKGIGIDIDYRLAPEYPFPVAFNESYDVVKWVFDNAVMLGIDSRKVIVGGHSAGGNLTAAIAMKAQETGDFHMLLQIMNYPATDNVTDPAKRQGAAENVLPPDRIRTFMTLYTDDNQETANSPYVSMLFAPDSLLQGLPDALIITAGRDSFRFEGEQYGARLVANGVVVTEKRFLNSNHGFLTYCKDEWNEAQLLILDVIESKLSRI